MEPSQTVVTTARVGQRGRLILPAQAQRATGITPGTQVVVRTGPAGSITIEPLWAVANRLRSEYAELLDGHLPGGAALLFAGGRDIDIDPSDLTVLGPVLHHLPDRAPASGRRAYRDDRGPVLTARAVLAWLTADHGTLVVDALPFGVMPEAAVSDLITVLAHAGAHQRADALLVDLGVLGLRLPGPSRNRTTLAQDTAVAVDLIGVAAQAGYALSMPDALCAAAARRLETGLIAADLLTPVAP
ncbi:AbrB/MazE/SpoVT family DNA-binding domain-containing protein [Streptomyces sp. NPDC004549]|uniref:AbrB/MazE/SpoVT family DNA-binding domain-containing protein n=1 Tax=Streptomyces sp. NPDC004549 TaxID=3154283 RepID=UPI0033AB8E47